MVIFSMHKGDLELYFRDILLVIFLYLFENRLTDDYLSHNSNTILPIYSQRLHIKKCIINVYCLIRKRMPYKHMSRILVHLLFKRKYRDMTVLGQMLRQKHL